MLPPYPTKIEVSTQVLMVASYSQNGTKVPGPRLDWPALLVPRSQARQSDGLDQSHAQRPSLIAHGAELLDGARERPVAIRPEHVAARFAAAQ